ncbi:MAG: class I tRNA ligase family protein, partial [Patescibacteria group bacterium]
EYFRWTQWIFLQLFKKGLAYEAIVPINFCPSCKTGLANEEVVSGKCERCGATVERKDLRQWMLRITSFADRLLAGLDDLDWPQSIKSSQRNWIGRSEGAEVDFLIEGAEKKIRVYTTRPDTLFGATYMVLAPEHSLVNELKEKISNFDEVSAYVIKSKNKSDLERTDLNKEKTGVELKGIKAVNPVNGEEIPVWLSDYVLSSYGTGAIMAVPAHDGRDWEFAKKFGIEIKFVIIPDQFYYPDSNGDAIFLNYPQEKDKILEKMQSVNGGICYTNIDAGEMINSDFLNGLVPEEAIRQMTSWLEEKGYGKKAINYKLRDWVFSRQRYWGEPIPLVHCEACRSKKQKILLIHGFEGSGEGNWLLWVKKKLEKNGFEVFNPTMTTSEHPDLESWLSELKPYINQMGEQDVVVGHSLGGKAALHLIERANKKIGYLFLVAPVLDAASDKEYDLFSKEWQGSDIELLKKFSSAKLDWDKISNLVYGKNVILSDDDPYIKVESKNLLPPGWSKEVWHEFGHFQEKEIPELLKTISGVKNTGWVPVPENELPLALPEVEKYEPSGTGESPLANVTKWVETKCPVCGGKAQRETNTMPQWAGSSWYWLRYIDPLNNNSFADFEKLSYWLPVDVYVGGAEHAVLHLLYARFWNMVLFDLGLVPQAEPFLKLINQGLILGEDGEKMSKSRGNVVNPDDVLKTHGADSFRLYEMFMGPLEDVKPWSTRSMIGIDRFLERIWNSYQEIPLAGDLDKDLKSLLHKTIKKAGEDIEGMRFNTAISALMVLINKLTEVKVASKDFWEKFLVILAPFAPHLCEELWFGLGNSKSVFLETWPEYDENLIKDGKVDIVVQINGKVRAEMMIGADEAEEEVKKRALENDAVLKYLADKPVKKVIYVKNRLINIVV